MPDGYWVRVLDEVDSTNAEAARVAASLNGPTWIVARQQSAARGRRGRAWQSPPGNLFATLVLTPREPADTVALRSFLAGLALFEACAEITDQPELFSLKWPNDVLCNGGKLAGILLESIGTGGHISHLSIGIGVNLAHAPDPGTLEDRALRPVSLAQAANRTVTPDRFLTALAAHYGRFERQFTTFGFAPIRSAFLSRAARLGEVITARLPGREITGTYETVDEQGNLVLKTAKGRETVSAADIFF